MKASVCTGKFRTTFYLILLKIDENCYISLHFYAYIGIILSADTAIADSTKYRDFLFCRRILFANLIGFIMEENNNAPQTTAGETKQKYFTARRIAYFAIFLALIVVLQTFGSYIRIGATTLSLVLIPIVLGGMLLGVIGGTVLGFLFGVAVILLNGVLMPDGFTNILIAENPAVTILTCLLKGSLAGFVPAIVFKLLKGKNELVATIVASFLAPVMNTGIFILGMLCMSGVISNNFVSEGTSVLYFLVIGCAGVNFLIELAINAVLSPALYRIIKVVNKRF